MSYEEIGQCRICGNAELVPIVDLGNQALTGVFPKSKEQPVTSGPLKLVKCAEAPAGDSCGLVQLRHTYDLDEMYGDNYGYRSGLNASMVNHLGTKVGYILNHVELVPRDLVIDIGSNDGTMLKAYPNKHITLVGIDPTGEKFREHYPDYVRLIPEFFSAERVEDHFGTKKARVVTSIAMFYDLVDPLGFMAQVYQILAPDGVWVFEQSYMPSMLDANAYDTICHEHLEYYRLQQIKWMADRVGFKIIDVEFNDVNGGSYSVMVGKSDSGHEGSSALVNRLLRDEEAKRLGSMEPYEVFRRRVYRHRDELRALLQEIRTKGETILGYGASTKGNVVLQFCGLTANEIPFMAEVNEDKFGRLTPGSHIPIIPEAEAKAMNPDYLLVMPWHFREFIVEKERDYLESGGKLVFPLPSLEIVSN